MPNLMLIGDRYNGDNRKHIDDPLICTLNVDKNANNNFVNSRVTGKMSPGTDAETDAYSTISFFSPEKVSIRKGFNTVFKLRIDDPLEPVWMDFGQQPKTIEEDPNPRYGKNGMVSFAWTSEDLSEHQTVGGYWRAIPAKIDYTSYSPDIQHASNWENGGGLGPEMWRNQSISHDASENIDVKSYSGYGFTLTLYPDKDAPDGTENRCRVKHFRLCVKKKNICEENLTDYPHIVETDNNVIVYEDDLPEIVDLSEYSSISLSARDEMGYINIFLNGVNIVSFYVDSDSPFVDEDTDKMYFAACVMGDEMNKPVFTFYSVNGVLMAVQPDLAGQIETMLNEIRSASELDDIYVGLLNDIDDNYPSNPGSPFYNPEIYTDWHELKHNETTITAIRAFLNQNQ